MSVFAKNRQKIVGLPIFFRPILWSYDWQKINADNSAKTVIIQAINYGDLQHWQWIVSYYGLAKIKAVLQSTPVGSLKKRPARLANIIFGIKKNNYAPRGTHFKS